MRRDFNAKRSGVLAVASFLLAGTSASALSPSISSTVEAAIVYGQDTPLREIIHSPEWEHRCTAYIIAAEDRTVPCAAVSGLAPTAHVKTLFYTIATAASVAKSRYDDLAETRKLGASLIPKREVSFSMLVSSQEVNGNANPVVVLKQGGAVMKADRVDVGNPSVGYREFVRFVEGHFSFSRFNPGAPFTIAFAGIRDDGRSEVSFDVDLSNVR